MADSIVNILQTAGMIAVVVIAIALGAVIAIACAVAAVPAVPLAWFFWLFGAPFVEALAWTWPTCTALVLFGMVSLFRY